MLLRNHTWTSGPRWTLQTYSVFSCVSMWLYWAAGCPSSGYFFKGKSSLHLIKPRRHAFCYLHSNKMKSFLNRFKKKILHIDFKLERYCHSKNPKPAMIPKRRDLSRRKWPFLKPNILDTINEYVWRKHWDCGNSHNRTQGHHFQHL